MNLAWQNGLIVKRDKTKISLDPYNSSINTDLVLVSHAHSDHTSGFRSVSEKIATRETIGIYKARSRRQIRRVKPLEYLKEYSINEIKIKLHNAGHVLGSAQIEINSPEGNLIYTSDINLKDSLTLKKAEILTADILIIESTYGAPSYIFPPREKIYFEIVEWAAKEILKGKIPVFQVYPVGKAQEIIKIFNEYSNFNVLVNSKIRGINNVYINSGVKINCIYDDEEESREIISSKEFVYVTSTSKNSIKCKIDCKTSIAKVTGWSIIFRNSNATYFPLSSHADFLQLLEYVSESNSKQVYTIFGHDKIFAKYLRKKLNLNAKPLREISLKGLEKFLYF